MRLSDLVDSSGAVGRTPARLEKIAQLADLLSRVPPEQLEIVISFLGGSARQGKIGVGGAVISALRSVEPVGSPSLDLLDVDRAFDRVAAISGPGATAAKSAILADLFRRATAAEQDFLVRVIVGELRQGAVEGVVVEAVARAAGTSAAQIRRAAMVAGSLAPVARSALTGGPGALSDYLLEPFRPVGPMLADSAGTLSGALQESGEACLEFKLDGARIQVHKSAGDVRIYSRSLRDVTASLPEVVAVARALPVGEVVLDGEAIALKADGSPHPFQLTMRRFGRKVESTELLRDLPIAPFLFDVLLVDGAVLIDEPQSRRVAILDEIVPASTRVPRLTTASLDEAERFAHRALAAGHEGVIVKAIDAPYAAGRRGHAWLKVKQARTLDLVVLAAEWGHGRRRGFLSNLHLGARDLERGGFVMLGKTFKGLTDDLLAWQTTSLLAREIARDGQTVYVRPELVVEIAFNDIQESPRYPGGLALRFARVKRYRPDKTAADADPFAMVQSIYRQASGREPPLR